MSALLNIANNVRDDYAQYLRDIEGYDNSVKRRHLDVYIAHNDMLIVVGYESDNLVWVSYTRLHDLFLSRRVYDCMREGNFYRSLKLPDVLDTVGLREKDLQGMCYARLDNIELDQPVFSGCIVGEKKESVFTGVDFAAIVAVSAKRLKSMIANVGSDDDIISELEKDRQYVEALYNNGVGFDDNRRKKIAEISNKWRQAECLKLSERAVIRTMYRDICYYEKNVIDK